MIKTFKISESAFSEKGTRKKKKMELSKGGFVNPVSNPASNAASADSSNWLRYPQGPVPPNVNESYTGGKQSDKHSDKEKDKEKDTEKHVKVELKKKISVKKVHLNPKTNLKTNPKTNPKKIKKSRKFVLGLSTFHKRITRAKKACKKINELPLDKLKEKLIKDGLIKSTSKAPESVLRQIANDAAIVNKRAL